MATLSLKPYQQRARDFVLSATHCGLWLEMGLGKTAATLAAVKALLWSGDAKQVLVIAPKRVAMGVWSNEINKWAQFNDLSYQVLVGPAKLRMDRLKIPADIYVINYENLIWLVELWGEHWPYDCVVVDESTKLKAPSGKRFRALRRVRKYITRIVQLTGTPAPNGYLDLWSQVCLLDGGLRLGKSFGAYKRRWFRTTDYQGYRWELLPGAKAEIDTRIVDLFISMRAEDYITLPELVINDIPLELSAWDKALYKDLENELFLQLGNTSIEVINAAAATGKCHQFANGAVYLVDPETRERSVISVHDLKLDALDSVIEEANGSPVMVAYWYNSDRDRLKERYPWAENITDSDDMEARWNAGEVSLMLVHPDSAGHGLNLQEGPGHDLFWFSLTWSCDLYEQLNKRLHRTGQQQRVIVHRPIVVGTLDEEMVERVETKMSVQELLKKRMERLYEF